MSEHFDIDKFLKNWMTTTNRVFYYYTYVCDKPDIVILYREEESLFICNKHNSTIAMKELSLEELYDFISCDILRWKRDGESYKNYKKKHNKYGCTCGAWRTSNPKSHYKWCDYSKLDWLPPIPF